MNNTTTLLFVMLLAVGCTPADPLAPRPAAPAALTNLSADTAALRKLPGVHSVEIARQADQPTHRIIHVLNFHFVPRDAFAADVRDQDDTVSDDEIDRLYDEFLDDVEAVQQEQMGVLGALVRRHKLRGVHYEGISDGESDEFKRLVKVLHDFDEHKPQGDTPVGQFLLGEYRLDLLRIGAPGRLMMAGGLEDVLPVEDAELFAAANPVGEDGAVQIEQDVNERREDAIVAKLLESGPVSVVVLGGRHDLSDNVPEGVEYVRVETGEYRRAIEPQRAPQ